MPKGPAIPKDDLGKCQWLSNLSSKLPAHAATVGVTSTNDTLVRNVFLSGYNGNGRPTVTSSQVAIDRSAGAGQIKVSVNNFEHPTTVLKTIGINKIVLNTSAGASNLRTTTTVTNSPCGIALDPHASKAFSLISPSNVGSATCEIHVLSDGGSAAYIHSPAQTLFHKICVKGGKSSDSDTSVPAALNFQTNCTPMADPLAATIGTVQAAARAEAAPCVEGVNRNRTYNNVTMNPGTFCGVTTISGNSVTFNPGLYIIQSGSCGPATLNITASIVKGNGVTFFFLSETASLNFSAKEDGTQNYLRAPTTGTYKDMLIFEDAGQNSAGALNIVNADKQLWAGIVYTPSRDIVINSTSDWVGCNCTFIGQTLKTDSLSNFPWTPYKSFTSTVAPTTTTGPIHLN